MSQVDSGRANQKSRTRSALLDAVRVMIREGKKPTLPEAADLAKISRATAYRYYSDAETMVQEAVLDGLAETVGSIDQEGGTSFPDAPSQLLALVDRVMDLVLDNEALFRLYLRSTLGADGPTRGGRRLRWVSDIIDRHDDKLSAAQKASLVHSLSLLTGIETVIVLRDVCGLDDHAIREQTRWSAKAMIEAVYGTDS